MNRLTNWMVCADLSNMDNLLLGYVNFLSSIFGLDELNLVHVLEKLELQGSIESIFPDVHSEEELRSIIRDELGDLVSEHISGDINLNMTLHSGSPTQNILTTIRKFSPDVLVLGKKTNYSGEGIISNKIARFAPCPVIFVPETVTYSLDKALVLVTFNERGAKTVRFADQLREENKTEVILLNVYDYSKQYFPFIPSKTYTEKLEEHLQEEYESFKKEHDLPDLPIRFTANEKSSLGDAVYDAALKEKADLIISGAARKSDKAALLAEDRSERLAQYDFRIPYLIYKDPSEHEGLLRALLSN